MQKLYDLKETLCKELESYGTRNSLDMNSLEVVDKLAHAIKNIDKILQGEEEYSSRGGSNAGSYGSYEGGSNAGSYRMSGKRDSMGRFSRRSSEGASGRSMRHYRDGMGRYVNASYAGDEMVEKLEELMEDAPDDRIKAEIQKLISKVEQG